MSDPEIDAAIEAAFGCVRLEAALASLGRAIAREAALRADQALPGLGAATTNVAGAANRAASRRRRNAIAQNH